MGKVTVLLQTVADLFAHRRPGRYVAEPSGGGHSTLPWVAATVIALEPRGMATTRTVDGMTSTVIKETTWRLGDTVACEHVVRTRVPWEPLDCRKTS